MKQKVFHEKRTLIIKLQLYWSFQKFLNEKESCESKCSLCYSHVSDLYRIIDIISITTCSSYIKMSIIVLLSVNNFVITRLSFNYTIKAFQGYQIVIDCVKAYHTFKIRSFSKRTESQNIVRFHRVKFRDITNHLWFSVEKMNRTYVSIPYTYRTMFRIISARNVSWYEYSKKILPQYSTRLHLEKRV